jgi:hypothetical protein
VSRRFLVGVVLAALSAIPISPVSAAGPGAPEDERRACNRLADAIRSAAPDSGSTLEKLTKTGTGLVRMDMRNDDIGYGNGAKAALRRLLRWPDKAEVPDFTNWHVSIRHVGGGSSVIAAEMVTGTAHCQQLWFYELPGTGAAKPIALPEQNDGSAYCWGDSHGSYATLGEVGGIPTFAVEDFGDGNEAIRLIAQRGDAWHSYCRLDVAWPQRFAVTEEFCRGDGCAALRAAAPDLVKTYDATREVDKFWAAVPSLPVPEGHKARFAQYIRDKVAKNATQGWRNEVWPGESPDAALADAVYRTIEIGGQQRTFVGVDHGNIAEWFAIWAEPGGKMLRLLELTPPDTPVPTLGEDADTSYTRFGFNSAIVPFRFGGKLLLARIGRGNFGWRESDDYLVGLFALEGNGMMPVAGVVVGRQRAPSPTVTRR